MIVRALHLGFEVPDHDAAIATLYYAADGAAIGDARLTGAVAADESAAPWPVVVIVPGINVGPDGYRWLAVRLVKAGFAAVTYSAIGSLGPAGRGITPALDMAALAPDTAGSRPSAVALRPLLDALRQLDGTPVAGMLGLDRVALVGHSAGGTVALHNSRPDWIPGLRAVASYAGHTMTATALGHDEAVVVAIPAEVPVLLSGGATDGVIDQSRDRYTTADGVHDPIGRTFEEAIARDEGDCWLVELADGNHFTICDPVDETSGRSFLEPDLRADDVPTRDLLARVLIAFLAGTLDRDTEETLESLVTGAGISRWAQR